MKLKQKEKRAWHRPTLGIVDRNDCVHWVESYTERDYALSLAFDPSVREFKSQPFSLVYENTKGKERRYTPDMLVHYWDGRLETHEVKPAALVKDSTKWRIAQLNRHMVNRKNVPLKLITDDSFRQGARIKNLKRLYGYRKVDTRNSLTTSLLERLPYRTSLEDLVDISRKLNCPETLPFALIYRGFLTFDFYQPLGPNTELELTHEYSKCA